VTEPLHPEQMAVEVYLAQRSPGWRAGYRDAQMGHGADAVPMTADLEWLRAWLCGNAAGSE
jgi:hypothetical protein